MTANSTLELLTVTEAARRIGACSVTLKRRIARSGVIPDAVLIEGTNRLRSPLFVEPRVTELAALIRVEPKTKNQ